MSTQFAGQRFFVSATPDPHGAKTHLPCVLNAQMTQTANALYRYQIASPRACIAERVVHRDAGAKERGRLVRRQVVRKRRHGFSRGHHVLGIAAVKAEPSDFLKLAEDEVAAPAGITHKAVAAMPAHPHTLTRLPVGYTFAHRIHVPSDLMTWHARIVQARPETVFHHHIAVADAASFDFDAHLSASGLRDFAFNEFKGTIGASDLYDTHL